MHRPGISAKYWIYLLVVIFAVPTLLDAWSVTRFFAIASCFGVALVIGIVRYLWTSKSVTPAHDSPRSLLLQPKSLPSYKPVLVWTDSLENNLIRSEFLVTQHTAELILRRRQLTVTSNYGLADDSGWFREVDHFIERVIEGSGGDVNNSPDRLRAVRSMIDYVTSNFAISRVAFSPEMDPIEYEHFVADALSVLGWETRVTKASGDQGVDVIAEMRGKRVVIQCKRYASPIGNSAVQEAFAGKSFERADYAVVVSNAEFTRSARQLADTTHVILLHHEELSNLELQIFGTVAINTAQDESSSAPATLYMTPVCYEQAVADGLKNLGWQTQLKATTEDRYADVIAEMDGKRVMITCWGFMEPGIPSAEGISTAKLFEGADYAAIVSNAALTPSDRQRAATAGIVLLRHDNLTQLKTQLFGNRGSNRQCVGSAAASGFDRPPAPLARSKTGFSNAA